MFPSAFVCEGGLERAERRFGANARCKVEASRTKGSAIRWLQSQEQKLLRARSGSVIRMLMRATIGRARPKPAQREERLRRTRESPVALLKRGAFFGLQIHVSCAFMCTGSIVIAINKREERFPERFLRVATNTTRGGSMTSLRRLKIKLIGGRR